VIWLYNYQFLLIITSVFVVSLWHCLMIILFQNVRSNYQVASRSEQDVNNSLYWANKVLWLQGQTDEVHVQIEVRYIQTGRRYGKDAHNLYWYGRIYTLCLRRIFVLIFCMIKTGLSLADWVSLKILRTKFESPLRLKAVHMCCPTLPQKWLFLLKGTLTKT